MATRTRSHSNVDKSVGSIGVFGNSKQVKRNKKRSSDVGTTKSHQYSTRSGRGALTDVTNCPVGANAQGGGGKRINTGKHRDKKRSTVSSMHANVMHHMQRRQHMSCAPSANGVDNLMSQDSLRQVSPFADIDFSNEEGEVPMKDESEDEDLIDEAHKMKQEEEELIAIDSSDMHNPQAVSEYIQDIMIYFKGVERDRSAKYGYMTSQRDINSKMREILIDWLNEVHLKFKLRLETMYLTVNLIDRFLMFRAVSRTKLQLVGCTAMLIASKYEEIYAPEVRDFVYISDKAYNREQILMMESIMLNTLDFNLTVPTALRFGQRFMKLVKGTNDRFKHLVEYLMELTLQNYDFLKYMPSKIAASAVYLALVMDSGVSCVPEWTGLLQRQSGYGIPALKESVTALHALAAKIPEKYKAVRKKYSSSKYLQVAKISVVTPLF